MEVPSLSVIIRRLVPRSLWLPIFFVMMGFISLINPRLVRPLTPDERQARRRRLAWLRRRQAALPQRQLMGRLLGCNTPSFDLPLPEADDILILSHGIPVVPWLKRVGVRQWALWLDHLGETLRARYPDRADIAPGIAWEEWLQGHVRYVEAHFARIAGQRIARLLAALPEADVGNIYLFGHSAGGSAILQYLADLRDGSAVAPARPIRAALTLDAAVWGPARLWTGWPIAPERPGRMDHLLPKLRHYLTISGPKLRWHRHLTWSRNYMELPFRGLGAWAQEQGFTILTVSNLADAFSHPQLDDLPYLEMHIGRRFDIKGTATGRTHLCVQRDPRVPHYLWWHDEVPLRQLTW